MRHQNIHLPSIGLYGLVVCGGKSSRMGEDKSMLVYHDKPQRYWLYETLKPFCEKVFISCNDKQTNHIEKDYPVLTDLPAYGNCGPIAALLTAFSQYADKNFLVIGCDYPFLAAMDIRSFLVAFKRTETAAAFYNDAAGLYEPLLAYYNHQSSIRLLEMYTNTEYSLQQFLKENNAVKFYAENIQSMKSIDTREDYLAARILIKNRL